jgi:hypothetical protein
MARFAIEYSDQSKGFGHIHSADCRDLIDGDVFEVETPTAANVTAAAEEFGDGFQDEYPINPCARKLLQK